MGLASSACRPSVEPVESRLDEIRHLHAAERFEESIELLEEILAGTPGHAEANHLLGTALLRTGSPTRALWPLRRASLQDAFAIDSGLLLASTLFVTGNPEEAVAAANRVLKRDPTNIEARLLGARAHVQLRDARAALGELEAALAVVPDHVGALWLRAGVLGGLGRYAEAEETYGQVDRLAAARGDEPLAVKSCTAAALLLIRRDQPEHLRARAFGSMPDANATPLAPELSPEHPMGLSPSLRAEKALRRCVDQFPTQILPVSKMADYLLATGELEQARDLWNQAVERAPASLAFRVGLANQLWLLDERPAAKETLREAASRSEDPRAWQALAELHRLDGEFQEASAALEQALARVSDRPELRFQHASLLVEAGRLDQAEAEVASLEKPEYRDILRGRILLERGLPEAALQAFDSGLRYWPNNAVARALAGHAARELGDLNRALDEYRESIRADARATDAALAAARIARALGEHEEAVAYAGYQVRSHPFQGLEPYRIGALSARAAGMEQAAETFLRALELQSRLGEAAILRAALAGQVKGPAAEVAVLEQSGLDLLEAENDLALRALVNAYLADGRPGDALALVERALAIRPESPDLLDVRGRVLLDFDREAEAGAAFERALALDPDHAGALAGLGVLAFGRGDLDQAFAHLEHAVKADPDDLDSAHRAAQLAAALKRPQEAEARLRALVARDPGHVGAANDLAWLLAEKGEDLDFALALAERAARSERAAYVLDTLAYVQIRRGELDDALRTLDNALATYPDNGTLHYRSGTALLAGGELEAAGRAIRKALDAGPFPEAEAARETLAGIESRTGGE